MKVYISADLEGIGGVVAISQLEHTGHDFDRMRKLMTEEVNAAVKGAISGGANDVLVNDSHGPMTNLLIEDLHEEARLITGNNKHLAMMQGIDSTFDAVVLIGYHSKQNTSGVLAHSFHSGAITKIRLNGIEVGEFEFNSYIAGYYNVPVVLVSGDDMIAEQAKELNSDIETVIVKNAVSHFSANCLHPHKIHRLIEERLKQVLEEGPGDVGSCKLEGPIELEVTFMNSCMVESAILMPGTELVSLNAVKYVAKDVIDAFKAFWVLITLSGGTL